MTLPKIPYKETRCAEHFNAGVTKASWSVHNECNECLRPVCFDCGKPKMGAWMSGVCDDCYRLHDRALRKQEADEKAEGRQAIRDLAKLKEVARDVVQMFSEVENSGELYYAPLHRMVDLLGEVAGE